MGSDYILSLHARVKYGRGQALNALVSSPRYDCADYTDVPYIDAAAVLCDDGSVTLFCVNRDMNEDYALEMDLRSFEGLTFTEHIVIHHDDVKAVNTAENPGNVAPVKGPGGIFDNGRFTAAIPALSWNVLRFSKGNS